MTECTHDAVDWDWGSARPSNERVVVPGRCHECETDVDRIYEYSETVET